MKNSITLKIIIFTSIILMTACSSLTIGDEQHSEILIKKDQAQELKIDLIVDFGEVDISTGAEAWVDGDIQYNINGLDPKVDYTLKNQIGKIKIHQPKKGKVNLKSSNEKNDWNLQLNKEVPVNLNIQTGASDTHLDLQGMQLHSLNVKTGVGETFIDLSGQWQDSFDINIEIGVGKTTIILPKDVGVEVHPSAGIGSVSYSDLTQYGKNQYVNEAFFESDIILSVWADIGVGKVKFLLEE